MGHIWSKKCYSRLQVQFRMSSQHRSKNVKSTTILLLLYIASPSSTCDFSFDNLESQGPINLGLEFSLVSSLFNDVWVDDRESKECCWMVTNAFFWFENL